MKLSGSRDKRRPSLDMPRGSGNMSPSARGFLQKICYKRPASVDMTHYGFVNDSKANPVNLLLKPLREKLEKIVGPSKIKTKKRAVGPSATKKRVKGYYVCKNLNRIDSRIRVVTSTDSGYSRGVSTPDTGSTKMFRSSRRISFRRS